jgi:hypothetical protein
MGNIDGRYRPLAWQLARERIGQELRKRYRTPAELPATLLALVRKLDEKSEDLIAGGRGALEPQRDDVIEVS